MKTKTKREYEAQANAFLKKTGGGIGAVIREKIEQEVSELILCGNICGILEDEDSKCSWRLVLDIEMKMG